VGIGLAWSYRSQWHIVNNVLQFAVNRVSCNGEPMRAYRHAQPLVVVVVAVVVVV
jgi:hypothetical protein